MTVISGENIFSYEMYFIYATHGSNQVAKLTVLNIGMFIDKQEMRPWDTCLIVQICNRDCHRIVKKKWFSW